MAKTFFIIMSGLWIVLSISRITGLLTDEHLIKILNPIIIILWMIFGASFLLDKVEGSQ